MIENLSSNTSILKSDRKISTLLRALKISKSHSRWNKNEYFPSTVTYSCIQLRTYQLAIFCVLLHEKWPLTESPDIPQVSINFPSASFPTLSTDFSGSPRDITADHVHNTFNFIDPPLMRSNTFSSCPYENRHFRQLAWITWHYPLLTPSRAMNYVRALFAKCYTEECGLLRAIFFEFLTIFLTFKN